MMMQFVLENFDTIFRNKASLDNLEKMILDLAVRGKLVPQDSKDEPASELIKKIKAEKERLIAEKVIKKEKPLPPITEEEIPFDIPESWEWVRLGKVIEIFSGKSFESSDFISETGVPAIKITNIGVGKFIESKEYLPLKFLEEYKEYIVSENDILMALTRPYIKEGLKICRYSSKYEKSLLNQRVALLRMQTNLNKEYIFLFMTTDHILNIFKNRFERQGLQPNLKIKDISDLYLPLPPLSEQQRIVEKVDRMKILISRLKEIYESNETNRLNLKKSILAEIESSNSNKDLLEALELVFNNFNSIVRSKADVKDIRDLVLSLAVKGKLVPQDSNDEPASELMKKIKAEKERLVAEKVIKKEKPLPPITEEEIPFDIPESWEWVRLGEVISLNMGQSPDGDTVSEKDEGLGLIGGPADMLGNFVNISRYTSKPTKICNKGDLILTVRATLGKTIFSDGEYCLGRGVAGLSSRISNLKYIQIILKNKNNYFYEIGRGSTFLQISKVDIENLIIPLPPLAEQQRIVEKVDSLMKVCDILEARISDGEKISEKLLESLLKI